MGPISSAAFAAVLAAAYAQPQERPPSCLKARFERKLGGRIYGHGSRKYAGPRDAAYRGRRPALTRDALRRLNVAWNAPEGL